MSNPYGYPNVPPGSGYPPMMPQHNYGPNSTPYTTYQGAMQPQHPSNPVYTNYGQPVAQPQMYHQPQQPQMQHHPQQPQPPPLSFHPAQQANNFHNVTALASPPPSLQQRPLASPVAGPPPPQPAQQHPPNLPPGISINRPKLPPGIQVQRTNSPPAPRPSQVSVSKTVPNLPSGIQIQREPQKSVPKLPPGISISQGNSASIENKLPKSVSISRNPGSSENNTTSMNRLSKLAGISISGGSSGAPAPASGGLTITKNTNGTSEPSSNPLARLSHLNVSVSGGSNGSSPAPAKAPPPPVAAPAPAAAAPAAPRAAPVTQPPRPTPNVVNNVNSNQPPAATMASSNNQPKTYRPLVKDFEQDGFDLSKVKLEKGVSQAEKPAAQAPSSYFQRRLEPMKKSTISITPASKESSESEEEDDEEEAPAKEPAVAEKPVEKPTEKASEEPSEQPSISESKAQPEQSNEPSNEEKEEENMKENEDHENDEAKEDATEPMEQDANDQEPKESEEITESKEPTDNPGEDSNEQDEQETEEKMEENQEEEESNQEAINASDENSMDVQAEQSPQESPFKRPSDTISVDGNSMTSGMSRPRHFSTASDGPEGSEADSDSNAEQRQQRSDLDAQYEVQLAFYNKKHVVGQDTVCMFCLTRCASKEPIIMTCLHSACSACFKQSLEEAQSRNDKQKPDVVTVEMDEDGCPIEQEIMVTCPLCKETSTERDVVNNLFCLTSNAENANEDDDIPKTHMCESCDDSNFATMACADCECNLCEDCVKAHKRLKNLKDHQLSPLEIADANSSGGNLGKSISAAIGTPHDLKCKIHDNGKLELYCETCEILTCKDCQLSEKHKMHKHRPTHEVVQDVKAGLGQAVSDIKLKKNTLDENRALLDTEVTKINIKEKSLMTQLQELKSYFMSKIEARFKELTKDVSEKVRVKRKAICGRKTTLDKFHSQAEYALNFIDYAVQFSDTDDKALLVAKRSIERRVRRLKKLDSSTGLQGDAGVKLDLYFQHYASQQMHSSLESVIKQVMGDLQILSAPPPVPAPPPMPINNYQVQQQQNQMILNRPTPVQRMPTGSPTPKAAPIRRTPVTTPTKNTTPTKPRGSPMRGGMVAGASRGRGAAMSMPTARGGRGATAMTRGGRVLTSTRGGGTSMASRGGAMRGMPSTRGRGAVTMSSLGVRGGGVIKRGAAQQPTRGAVGGRGSPAMMRGAANMMRGPGRPANLAPKSSGAVSITTVPSRNDNKPPPLRASPQIMRGGAQQQMGMMQQGANGSAYATDRFYMAAYGGGAPPAPAPAPARPNQGYGQQQYNQFPNQMRPQQQQQPQHPPGSSWHTPQGSTASMNSMQSSMSSGMADNSFKITIPSKNVRPAAMMPTTQHQQMVSSSPGIMSYDKDGAPIFSSNPPAAPTYHNNHQITVQKMNSQPIIPSVSRGISITSTSSSHPPAQSAPNPLHQLQPPQTKKDQDAVPDLTALLDDDDWMNQAAPSTIMSSPPPLADNAESDPLNIDPLASTSTTDQTPMVSIQKTSAILETELDLGTVTDPNTVKTELKKEEKSKDDNDANEESAPEMQGNEEEEEEEEEDGGDENDWCAVCHDGGDTLYCCDRCPKVYHLFCYIPPLTEEPPDDWVCDMCRTQDEIFSFSTGKKIPKEQLSESDQKMCTRILFELYNKYPESVMFRDCSDLNFKEYLDIIKEPIALDVIKEKLDRENPEMYVSVAEFLSDIRKMFRNCLKFHERGSDFFTHGKTLEEFLDKFLEQWLPDYAYETFEGSNFRSAIVNPEPSTSTGKKRKKHRNSTDDEEIVKKKKKAKKAKKVKKQKRSRRSENFINDHSEDSDSVESNLSDISNTEQLDRLDDLEAALSRKKKKAHYSDDEDEEMVEKPAKKGKAGGKKRGPKPKKKK